MTNNVGYKKPPKRNRFKKGRSGNPKGRPKKSRNFMTLLSEELDQAVLITEDGKKRKVSKLEAMVKRLVAGALQGDRKSMLTLIEVLRRTEHFNEIETEDLLPDNYEKVLDGYVRKQMEKKKLKKQKKEKNNE